MRLPVAVLVVLAATGCGGAADRAAAPVARPSPCVRVPTDLAAPGPYAVRRVLRRLVRHSAVARGPRRIDPTVWRPSGGCRFPLILFSHGRNGAPASCERLCSHLASHGFVVLAPTHPDRRTPRAAQGPERVEDLLYLLDHPPARVDARAIGVAGHSFGGRTAAELASQDERVRALMTMAGGADRAATALIRAPTLMVAGGADRIDPARLSEASYRALPRTTLRALLVIEGAGHGAFLDGCGAARLCAVMRRTAAAFFITHLAHRRVPLRVDDARLRLTAAGMR
jgi:predicted dienelactone hydrolase